MTTTFKSLVQQFLTIVGACSPGSLIQTTDQVVRFMRLGRWMADHRFQIPRRVADRNAVFDAVIEECRDRMVLYLEFGVFQGASMKYWSHALKHPSSVLHGFDSFEGLPESWSRLKEGAFTTGGNVPTIDDRRVTFFKGWFEEVLSTYQIPNGDFETIVINIDADLYSSSACILRHMRPHIRPGVFLYFDDLSHLEDEPKAFDEFLRSTGLRFRLVAATRSLAQAMFVCEK